MFTFGACFASTKSGLTLRQAIKDFEGIKCFEQSISFKLN